MREVITIETQIHDSLKESLTFLHCEITNESYKHGYSRGPNSHFKIVIVSEVFSKMNRLERQKYVYEILTSYFNAGLHALSLKLLTPEEALNSDNLNFNTPLCRGGK